ncbi:prepilin-type N-terminal cleavage/methylation domain-containing protein [Providencia vermicola]|uniref:Prepilin-type N-terminal cleavage/methylation domain-containing protein n=1 Tax=Providencia vermicola TaxID=333965 RepID=A0AAX3RYM4_9GAMM|nr:MULTISPECIES: prepilin-type N-terminal cleavage/methylation domain-containing protein [Providencia]ELX8377606.1 prepilin-type N-terminal cleavage/methylation domain-containing protein [Providencia stuartii]EMD5257147.1 prepilin-type N-terminal cleavage/methylation domain-containing protein [Providencia stuartii]USB37133.1 prepilin-type N-terminal cleavage/methylation domain-containing protein [Providencia vermicola]WFC06065.1 prepilin-type N-terminal cleavage/methylation domain-containing pr
MKALYDKQRGFILIESMVSVVVFAILLMALLSYNQHIALNFNWIYHHSLVFRVLQNNLERQAVLMEPQLENTEFISPDWQINLQTLSVSESCSDTTIMLSTAKQSFSLNRWFCRTGDNNVSGLSF